MGLTLGRRQPTLQDVWRDGIQRLRASAPQELVTPAPSTPEPPIWEPLAPQPGRGFTMPDGRVVSPQQAALESWADELFYGGAPGGGKSHLELGLAITQHRSTAIFRRHFSDFKGPEGLLAESRRIIGLRGHQANNEWTNVNGGRALEFLGCDHVNHIDKYQGRPHDLKCFDELPQFPKEWYLRLIGWLRTSVPGQRVRVVSTGNPPVNEEGMWVLEYWGPWLDKNHANPAKDGELRWYYRDKDGKDIEVPGPTWGPERPAPVVVVGWTDPDTGLDKVVEPRSRTFIGSRVEDNPYYMATGYANVLDNLPEPMRSMMRHGNFKAARGDDPFQLIPSAWVDAAQARWHERKHEQKGPWTSVGADLSRGGEDEFVLAPLRDDYVEDLLPFPAKAAPDGQAGALLIHKAVQGNTQIPVRMDVGGPGLPVYDFARQFGLYAIPMDGSRGSKARTRKVVNVHDEADQRATFGFANKRAEWHWRFREALDPVFGATLALPPDSRMRADLCAIRFVIRLSKIHIEDKADIKKRIGRSPDRGEAVIYGCAEDRPEPNAVLGTGPEHLDETLKEVQALRARMGLPPLEDMDAQEDDNEDEDA